jgi:hypothetical protein
MRPRAYTPYSRVSSICTGQIKWPPENGAFLELSCHTFEWDNTIIKNVQVIKMLAAFRMYRIMRSLGPADARGAFVETWLTPLLILAIGTITITLL